MHKHSTSSSSFRSCRGSSNRLRLARASQTRVCGVLKAQSTTGLMSATEAHTDAINKMHVPHDSAILLQGFGWESWKEGKGWWNTVADMAEDIGQKGFSHIWLPPPSQSVSPEGYLPSQLYNFSSKYGSKEELRRCIHILRTHGVKAVADCVYNHRCADKQNKAGDWVVYSNTHEPEGVATCAWDASAITADDPVFGGLGGMDTGHDFHAAPDLDHTNEKVQAGLEDFTRHLVNDLGFEGIRFDFSKGYGGKYAGQYARSALASDQIAIGEFWVPLKYDENIMRRDQDDNRQQLAEWMDDGGNRCLAFDFSTKGLLQEAIREKKYHYLADPQGRPAGLLGTRPLQAVTFIDNHDTGSTQAHWRFPRLAKLEGYAYILTHPGLPSVFWEHMYEESEDLAQSVKALMDLRRRAGVKASSPMRILMAEKDCYVADITGHHAVIRCNIGPRKDLGRWDPLLEPNWEVELKDKNTCVWSRPI